jgi:hypothetical protein
MTMLSSLVGVAPVIALLSLGAGCSDCSGGDCTPGTADCPCTSSGACGLGLVCQANKCVRGAPGTGGATMPASTVTTGGAPGSGGATGTGGAEDAAPSTLPDAAPDLPSAKDLVVSGDLTDAADAPAMLDTPIDRPITPADGPGNADAATEAAPPAGPTTYYVAPTGSDQAAGTLAAPFKTIQRCASLARPGDTCAIRAGTYRETVTPVRSGTADAHITFMAYNGECVTVSGADVLNVTWQQYQGSTYVADTSLRFIQLFANGKMLNEARWPNADPDDLVHMPLAQAGPATTETTLEGTTLPAGDWTGAYVFSIPGQRWVSYTRKIESYDQAKKIATWTAPMREPTAIPELAPRARDTYYVFGSLLALDSAGEWFLDSATGKLYLWAPGSVDPSTLKIEVKQRDYGFNLGARSYVDIKGLCLFATSIRMAGASRCVVDGVHARYISHLRETNGYVTGRADGTPTWTPTQDGLVVNLSNPGGSKVMVNLQAAGSDGGASRSWCVQPSSFGSPMFIPWEKFNSKCWNNSGAFYAREPLIVISVSVPGGLGDVPFSFCLDGIAPKLDTGDGSVESPLMATRGGKYAATAAWEGYFSSWASPGSTLTFPALSAVGTSYTVCASGTVKGTADYSGYAGFGFNLADRIQSSTAPAPDGDFDEWKNGSIAFAATEAIVAAGNEAKISNNVVHDTGYMAAGSGGISMENWSLAPARNELSDNTVSRTGRMGITNYGDVAARILRNRVSQAMQIIDDGGLIYSPFTDATSAEIAYNHLSDIPCIYGTGIYLDDGASGYTIHHNFIHDVSWWGVSLKKPNRFFNNTILRTALGAGSIYKEGNSTWVDLSSAVFSNNLIEQRPGVTFTVPQKQITDYGDYQIIVPVSGEWQKVTVPFASLRQPNFGARASLDLTNLTALQWNVSTLGSYEIDLDDVWLEGPTPKLLDDFEGASTNQLGGSWIAGCGNGSTCAKSTATGYTGNAYRLAGTTIKDGYAGPLTFLSPTSGNTADLSAYTGLSFRIRGTATLSLSNGTATTTPLQEHNLDCPVDGSGVPTSSCPVDRGGLLSPYTDGYSGTAPDVGAFESGQTPWTAGATTVAPTDLCPS